jgi:hypothetical protein
MPVPLTALFAAAMHQVKAAAADPIGSERVLGLLTRAAEASRVVFEVDQARLLVNGLPVSADAPGALLVRTALVEHDTSRLELPAGMRVRQWGEVAELFASSPGLFPSAAHVRDSLVASVPGAVLEAYGRPAMSDQMRAALFGAPDAEVALDATIASMASRNADRAEFSTRLDPILDEGFRAVEERDWGGVAMFLLQMQELEKESGEASRAIIARERRRVAPMHIIDILVRLLPKPSTPPLIAQAVHSLGTEGANAIIEALNGAPGRPERRTYIDALSVTPEGEAAILTALGSHRPGLVRDVAEAAGRRRCARAVTPLGALLRHADQEVRMAAYHALEEIATPEAYEALSRRN